MPRIFAADIGGTNGRFGWFEDTGKEIRLLTSVIVPTDGAQHFDEVLHRAIDIRRGDAFSPREADAVTFAVAGPVEDGRARLSNLGWTIDSTSDPWAQQFRVQPDLINDFVAQAFGALSRQIRHHHRELTDVPANQHFDPALITVKKGMAQDDGVVAAIGAGTGLGHCALLPLGSEYYELPSEAGHVAFPFITADEFKYGEFLKETTGQPYASGEVVVSGFGLSLLHAYCTEPWNFRVPEAVAAELTDVAEISRKITTEPSKGPLKTLRWFSRFYARVARHYALATLPRGGMYIAGGVAAKNTFLVTHPVFAAEFISSPVHQALLEKIPVYLVMSHDNAGLWGSVIYWFYHGQAHPHGSMTQAGASI